MGFCYKLFLEGLYKQGFIPHSFDIEFYADKDTSHAFPFMMKVYDAYQALKKKSELRDEQLKEANKLLDGIGFYCGVTGLKKGTYDAYLDKWAKIKELEKSNEPRTAYKQS